jgi:3-dehydroquinate synthase II
VLLRTGQRKELAKLRGLVDRLEAEDVRLTRARVKSLRLLGMGDRVCVDTCSIMGHGEGMLVGSSSACLFLIHAESIESEYVAARPFRVNAGPVHSYVLAPGARTRYLSELRSGDDVLLTDKRGRTRHAIVGRVKIERRPLLLLTARAGGRDHSVILQNAETIRLMTDRGAKSVSEIRPGDTVLVRLDEGGRHFGMKVRETVTEA